jgi:hypothetical protein
MPPSKNKNKKSTQKQAKDKVKGGGGDCVGEDDAAFGYTERYFMSFDPCLIPTSAPCVCVCVCCLSLNASTSSVRSGRVQIDC